MERIALGVEYDGSAYVGWQTQKDGHSIQQTVETALSRVADHPVATVCAGRTDAGVHAWGQVVHFDTEAKRSQRGWVLGANSNLPDDIAITWAVNVSQDFHARFSAQSRRYRYVILCRAARLALHRHRATWFHKMLDVTAMATAATHLLGKHDFSAFRAASCQANSATRELQRLQVQGLPDGVVIEVQANAFLQHMVRNIAGVLLKIGSGEASPDWAAQVLESRDRCQGGVTAPPQGLYFVGAQYPDEYSIPHTQVSGLQI